MVTSPFQEIQKAASKVNYVLPAMVGMPFGPKMSFEKVYASLLKLFVK